MHFDLLLPHIINVWIPHIFALGPWLYGLVFLTSVIESIPIVGTFAPGTVLLLFFGFTVYQGHMYLVPAIICAAVGGMVGDIMGYYIGRYGRHLLETHHKVVKYLHLHRGEKFFHAHGGKSVLLARFVGLVRPIVPILAGAADMPFKRFVTWNACGSFLWAGIYISLGYAFGNKWRVLGFWLGRFGKVSLVIVVLVIVIYIVKEIYSATDMHDETGEIEGDELKKVVNE